MCNITIKLIPNAKQSEIISIEIFPNQTINIKMKVHAPPQKGKANEAMLKLLSEKLSLRKSSMTLLSKRNSPIKKIYINKDYEEIIESLKHITIAL